MCRYNVVNYMGINILQTIPPNVSIMKRLLFGILATLPLAYCMTGCSNDTDYGGFSYFIWANDSDHRITLSVAREYGELVIENEIIEPGESFESKRLNPVYISDNQNLTISMVMI